MGLNNTTAQYVLSPVRGFYYIQLCFSSSGQQLWMKLNEVPTANNIQCPYQQLTMICKHPSTLNQPDWVVFNKTDVIFRSIDFQSSQLPNHSIVSDTSSEEVLMIHSLLPEFDGLLYYCLYDTINGEVRSNNLTVDIPGWCVMILVRLVLSY